MQANLDPVPEFVAALREAQSSPNKAAAAFGRSLGEWLDKAREAARAERARNNGRKSAGRPREYNDVDNAWIVAAVLSARRAIASEPQRVGRRRKVSDRAACERVVRDLYADLGRRLTNDEARELGEQFRTMYRLVTKTPLDLASRLFGQPDMVR